MNLKEHFSFVCFLTRKLESSKLQSYTHFSLYFRCSHILNTPNVLRAVQLSSLLSDQSKAVKL